MSHKDVQVVIKLEKVIQRLGFGIPLLLEGMASKAIPYTECRDIDEVKALYAEDTATYKAAVLIFKQEEPPSKIAVCSHTNNVVGALDELMDKGWRQLLVMSETTSSESSLKDIADYLETHDDKMYFANVNNVSALSSISPKDYDHTTVFYYEGDVVCPVAALVGATAGKDVGSFTYKNQILLGLDPLELTAAKLEEIHNAGAITFVQKAGDNVTSEGKTLGGEYIDVIDSKDWLIQQIVYKVQKTFNNMDKVPYTNNGINMLDAAVVTVLKEAFENGMVAEDDDGLPTYWTDFDLRSETDAADRVVRKYIGGSFGFELAGAIHEAKITGYISI